MKPSREAVNRPPQTAKADSAEPETEKTSREHEFSPSQVSLLNLQRTVGNQVVQQLVQRLRNPSSMALSSIGASTRPVVPTMLHRSVKSNNTDSTQLSEKPADEASEVEPEAQFMETSRRDLGAPIPPPSGRKSVATDLSLVSPPLASRYIQREPPTVDVRDLPMANQDQEKIRKAARDTLAQAADIFANLWYSANNGALAGTAEPQDPDFLNASAAQAKGAFGIALAGNLLWAATCLVPEIGVPALAVMSFGGAAAGSGTFAPGAPTNAMPSFKAVAAPALAAARDRISARSKSLVKDVADDCAANNISDTEEQRNRLWTKMFTTAYNQAEPIERAASAKLATAAPQFVKQWHDHKDTKEVKDGAWQRVEERIKRDGYPWSVRLRTLLEPSGPGGPADEYKLEIYNNEELPKYAAETFKPILTFN